MRAPVLTFKRARRLRREMSLPEVILWQDLRRGGLNGIQFRRQHPVGPCILDLFCPAAHMAVEIDGGGHDHPAQFEHDAKRDFWLKERGIAVLRFAAKDVLNDKERETVLQTIAAAVAPSTASRSPSPAESG